MDGTADNVLSQTLGLKLRNNLKQSSVVPDSYPHPPPPPRVQPPPPPGGGDRHLLVPAKNVSLSHCIELHN